MKVYTFIFRYIIFSRPFQKKYSGLLRIPWFSMGNRLDGAFQCLTWPFAQYCKYTFVSTKIFQLSLVWKHKRDISEMKVIFVGK